MLTRRYPSRSGNGASSPRGPLMPPALDTLYPGARRTFRHRTRLTTATTTAPGTAHTRTARKPTPDGDADEPAGYDRTTAAHTYYDPCEPSPFSAGTGWLSAFARV